MKGTVYKSLKMTENEFYVREICKLSLSCCEILPFDFVSENNI